MTDEYPYGKTPPYPPSYYRPSCYRDRRWFMCLWCQRTFVANMRNRGVCRKCIEKLAEEMGESK